MLGEICAIILLIIISPFFVITALLVLIFSGKPIFYKHKRCGFQYEEFDIIKFRTMHPNNGPQLTEYKDNRITNIGKILRKFKLDELPQLINIIKGEMVFVGPRPALYNQDDLVELRTRVGVHELMPGVTGWAQVNGRDELSIPVKVQFDEYYLKNRSWFLDLKIVFLTLLRVLGMKGVSH